MTNKEILEKIGTISILSNRKAKLQNQIKVIDRAIELQFMALEKGAAIEEAEEIANS